MFSWLGGEKPKPKAEGPPGHNAAPSSLKKGDATTKEQGGGFFNLSPAGGPHRRPQRADHLMVAEGIFSREWRCSPPRLPRCPQARLLVLGGGDRRLRRLRLLLRLQLALAPVQEPQLLHRLLVEQICFQG